MGPCRGRRTRRRIESRSRRPRQLRPWCQLLSMKVSSAGAGQCPPPAISASAPRPGHQCTDIAPKAAAAPTGTMQGPPGSMQAPRNDAAAVPTWIRCSWLWLSPCLWFAVCRPTGPRNVTRRSSNRCGHFLTDANDNGVTSWLFHLSNESWSAIQHFDCLRTCGVILRQCSGHRNQKISHIRLTREALLVYIHLPLWAEDRYFQNAHLFMQ